MKVFSAAKGIGKPKEIVFLGPVPERLIAINPGLKFCSVFLFYTSLHCLG